MKSTTSFNVGERIVVEIDPRNPDIHDRLPYTIAEATVTSVKPWGDGKSLSVDAEFDPAETEAIRFFAGIDAPWGGVPYPLACKDVLLRIGRMRAEYAAELHDRNVRCRTLLDALTAVGKGLGDDLRASLARIEAALAGRT